MDVEFVIIITNARFDSSEQTRNVICTEMLNLPAKLRAYTNYFETFN